MNKDSENILEKLIRDTPELSSCLKEIKKSINMIIACYKRGGKIMTCGNGGGAADAEHIVGELMKGFLLKRPINAGCKNGKIIQCKSCLLHKKVRRSFERYLRCLY